MNFFQKMSKWPQAFFLELTSKSYDYSHKQRFFLNSRWVISTTGGFNDSVTFLLSFFTIRSRQSNCADNSIKVYDGDQPISSALLRTLCNTRPTRISSSSNQLLIVYRGSNPELIPSTSFEFRWRSEDEIKGIFKPVWTKIVP